MAFTKQRFVSFLILFASTTFAQQSEPKEKTWVASIDLLQTVDVFSFETLKLSVEKKITPAFSIVDGGGYQYYNIYKNYDTLYYKPRGFKLDLEVRTYILKMLNSEHFTKPGGLFIGIQGFYRENKFTGNADYIKIKDDQSAELPERFTDDFGVRKRIFGANITTGWQKTFRKFVFEPSFGFGIMDRKITNNNISFNAATDKFDYNHGNGIPRTEDKSGTFFNLTMSVKFGYNF